MPHPFSKSFDLVQHSPLLHFQHDQAGATLRASEVKPKLDRFLIQKLGGEETVKADYQAWLVSAGKPGHMAFDYKLRIIPHGKPEKTEFVIIGNPGSPEAERETGILFQRGLTLEVVCLIPELMEWIEMMLESFFVLHNFGKRGSKGLGSFTLKETTQDTVERVLKEETTKTYRKNGRPHAKFDQDQYDMIGRDNQLLKSGFNHNGYQKSKLFEYARDQGLRWDKRKIKREINQQRHFRESLYAKKYPPIDIDGQTRWEDETDEEYRFFRAMLGLPELYEYLTEYKGRPGRNKYQVKIEQENIKRFRSPLTFKYVHRHVYVIAEEIPKGMFGQTFEFKLQTKEDKNAIQLTTIQTPNEEEFKLISFLDKYLTRLGYQPL